MIKIFATPLDRNQLFKLSLYLYFEVGWWVPIAFAVVLVINSENASPELFFIYLIVIIFSYILRFWRLSDFSDSRGLNIIEIGNDFIGTSYHDGSYSKIMLRNFTKAIKMKGYYYMSLNRHQYVVIKEEEFQSVEDKDWFEKNIFFKIKHQRV